MIVKQQQKQFGSLIPYNYHKSLINIVILLRKFKKSKIKFLISPKVGYPFWRAAADANLPASYPTIARHYEARDWTRK